MSESGAYIGRSVRSREAQRHVRGRGRYVDDMVLPRMLHAFVLRSPYGHARIESVDAAPALERPGVVGTLTPDDVMRLCEEASAAGAYPVTTEKDWVRLPVDARAMVAAVRVEVVWDDPAALDRLLAPLLR